VELSEENVVFTKRSDAEDEAVRVRGQINPVYDKEGSIIGYKVSGRVELTISDKLGFDAKVSSTTAGETNASVSAAILGDTFKFVKGKRTGRGGRDPRDYEQFIASLGPVSLSYKKERGEYSKSRKLGAQYDFPIGDARVSVHGDVREEQRRVQRFFHELMKWSLGASAQGPVGGGVAALGFNRSGGGTKPVTDIFGEYKVPIGPGEATFSGAIQDGDQRDWRIGAQYKVPF
jgi:hypothetical protein